VLGDVLDALGEAGDLELLADLPVDEGLDVGVVEVEAAHLGGAAGGATGLDGAGGAVTDAEEGHQAGGLAAAGEGLVLAAELVEIGAGAGAVLEKAGLAGPEVHDAGVADEVVADGLNEAGVRLGAAVGVGRLLDLAGLLVAVEVALGGAGDAVGEVEA